MIRMAIIYNKTEDSSFDLDYYIKSHMPMAAREFGAFKWDVDNVVSGADGSVSPIHCIGYLYFESEEKRLAGMNDTTVPKVIGDVPNYYKPGMPVAIISEVVDG